MLALIVGGSGSGKSAFAEEKVLKFGDYKRIYIATMQIFDEEGKKKVARHRQMRSAKNFDTIESPLHLEKINLNCENSKRENSKRENSKRENNCYKTISKEKVVLLECMSNLVANEMFSPEGRAANLVDIICGAVENIEKNCKALVIVTNDVFADGIIYDDATDKYMKVLGEINCRLGEMADEVYEVISGIPTKIKG